MGSEAINFIVTTGSTIILARLLVPEDYGLIAMVAAVVGFVLIFKDLGLAQAVVQKESLDHNNVSQIFLINTALSFVLAILIAAMAPLIANFYDEPKLLEITLAYALVAILGGLGTQHQALLSRQMQFRKLAGASVASKAVSVGIGIVMAFMGYGYWALLAVTISGSLFNTIQLWYYCNWRPSLVKIDRTVVEYVKFGMGVSGFNIINYLSRNLDNVLIGKFVGTAALGIYSKGYQLLMLPINQLRNPLVNVGLPAMSSLVNEPARYRDYYRKYVFLLGFLTMPIVCFLAVSAEPVVLLILGEQWIEVGKIFQLLSIIAIMQAVTSSCGLVLISMGQTKRYFWYGVINSSLMVVSFFIGIEWGVEGLIIASTIGFYLLLIPIVLFCIKKSPVKLIDFLSQVAYPLVFSLMAAGVTWLFTKSFVITHLWLQVILNGLVYGVVFLGLWMPFRFSRRKMMEVWDIIRTILKK